MSKGRRQIAALVGGLLCLLALASCGGGSNATTTGTATTEEAVASRSAALERANANCKQLLHGVLRIAREAQGAAYGTSLVTVTEALAKPATRLTKGIARRQRALERAIDDPQFDLYVHLFDPIVVLAEERVRAGEAEEAARAEQLQNLLINLGAEQRLAARRAGLHDCEIDFFGTMVRAFEG
jgi:hypothetical protein